MIRTCATLALAFALLVAYGLSKHDSADDVYGDWSAIPREGKSMRFEFLLRDSLIYAAPLTADAFAGLSEGDADAGRKKPVRFRLTRDAGTLTLEGSFHRRVGAGRFRFTPNRRYFDSLRALGVDAANLGAARRRGRAQLDHALLDATPEHVRELRRLGYADLPVTQIAELATHGASAEFVRALGAEGYSNLSPSELVRLRVAGVGADTIREYRQLGHGRPTLEQLVALPARGPNATPPGPFHRARRRPAPVVDSGAAQ
jgi:hypothetical protein